MSVKFPIEPIMVILIWRIEDVSDIKVANHAWSIFGVEVVHMKC